MVFYLLNELGAIERKQGRMALTGKGALMAAMPLDPRISRMMIEACKEGCVEDAAVIAGIISIQDPRERPIEKAALADQMHAPYKDMILIFLPCLRSGNSITASGMSSKHRTECVSSVKIIFYIPKDEGGVGIYI
jgi:ATP-dependent helicase HrpA